MWFSLSGLSVYRLVLFVPEPSLLDLSVYLSQSLSLSLSLMVACSLTWYSICRTPQFCRISPPPILHGLCLDEIWNLWSMCFSKILAICPIGICMVIFTQHNERFTRCSLCLLRWYAHCLVLSSSLFRTGETHAVERRQRKSEAPARPTGSRLAYSDLTWTCTESLPCAKLSSY